MHLNHRKWTMAILAAVFTIAGVQVLSAAESLRVFNDVETAGPARASVDRRYASPKAARETLAAHHLHTYGTRQGFKKLATALLAAPSDFLDPILYGAWTVQPYPTNVRAVHVTVLHNGKVLLIAGSGGNLEQFAAGTFTAEVWDPVANTFKQVPPPYDMFCAGHVVLPDGNVLIMGGTRAYKTTESEVWKGLAKTYIFNVSTETWETRANMRTARWYPTAIQDPTGNNVLVYAGRDLLGRVTEQNEIYNIHTNTWSPLPARKFPLYPGMLLTAKDELFFSGAASGTTTLSAGLLSPYTGAFRPVPGGVKMTTRSAAATVFAGAVQDQLVWLVGGGFPATNTTVLTDLKSADPVSVPGPLLPTKKAYVSAVNLPDLTVLETGGGTARGTPVFEASIFNPIERTIRPVAPPSVGRTYHSSAILLQDGSVATIGGSLDPVKFEFSIEIYQPSYFFKGSRPTIFSAPTEVGYGATYPITAAAFDATLTSAVLIRPSSTTHSTDANQRSIALGFEPTVDGAILTIPDARNIAPPGWYMLFVNDSLGRPSEATWVHLT